MTGAVRVVAPSRLHFGLLALGPEHPKQFGGCGLMVQAPGIALDLRRHREPCVVGCAADVLQRRARRVLADLGAAGIDVNVRVRLDAAADEHVGLGTGTQLTLALVAGVRRLAGQTADTSTLARLSGRAQRSAIGLHGFVNGGLLVDDGKGPNDPFSPLLVRHDFPEDWPVVLVRLALPLGLHGTPEREAFADRLTITLDDSQRLRRLLMVELMPAVKTRDYRTFANAVYRFNRMVGSSFAQVQGGDYAHPLLVEIVDYCRGERIAGLGQSSWGPTLFFIGDALNRGQDWARRVGEEFGLPDEAFTITRAANRGALITAAAPRLLVSVRDLDEARAAWQGGADILDLKEPNRGSLGMVDSAVARTIVAGLRREGCRLPITMALGELADAEHVMERLELPRGLWLAKAGFAGVRESDWRSRFAALARRCRDRCPLIPASYADWQRAGAPSPHELLALAKQHASPFLLLDTWMKDRPLGEWLPTSEMSELLASAEAAGVDVALAGSLGGESLSSLARLNAAALAVFAVRGAACANGNRHGGVVAERVANLKAVLAGNAAWAER